MSDEELQRQEEEFSARLAAYQESLASGSTPTLVNENSGAVDPRVAARLRRAQGCIRLLEQVWPHSNSGTRTSSQMQRASDPASFDVEGLPTRLGRFQIVRELGRGGYGIVFLAVDPRLGRKVALKVPRPETVFTPGLRRRFLREAAAAAGLDHPNLLTVYEVGEAGPVCYIASAFCEGVTLADWLERRSKLLPPRTAAELMAILADAVGHAHRRGILHRDVKPGNVLLEPKPSDLQSAPDGSKDSARATDDGLAFVPKLADFGLAKVLENDGNDTRTGAVMGTPAYMAPEQAEGWTNEIGTHTDVYGLGAILYELLTGRRPYQGNTETDTLRRILSDEPVPPRRLRPALPHDLEAICLKCLEKRPERRYATAGALAEDLRRFLAGEPSLARPVGSAQRAAKWARRRPAAAGLIAISIVATSALSAGGWWHAVSLQNALAVAKRERTNAQRSERLALEQQRIAKRSERRMRELLYAADIELAHQAWQRGEIEHMQELLSRHRPEAGQRDLRGFEWFYLERLYRENSRARLTLTGHSGEIYCAAFSPDDGTLATGGEDGTVRFWNATTGGQRGTLTGHISCVNGVVYSPDGSTLATASCDGTVKLWNVAAKQELATLRGHAGPVYAGAWSAEGTLLATGDEHGVVVLWDPSTGEKRARFQAHPVNSVDSGKVESLAISPDGTWLATANGVDNSVAVWELATLKQRLHLSNPSVPHSLAYQSDSKTLASGCGDGTVRLHDIDSGRLLGELRGHTGGVRTVAFSRDGVLLASAGEDRTVRLWDTATREVRSVLKDHADRIYCVAFSCDGALLAVAGKDGTTKVWGRAQGQSLSSEFLGSNNFAFSRDGKKLVTWGESTRVWDVATLRPITEFAGDKAEFSAGACSGDGRIIATARVDGTVEVWNTEHDERPTILVHGKDRVSSVAVSPDGRWVASSDARGVVKLWEAVSGPAPTTLTVGRGETNWVVTFSPESRMLAAAGLRTVTVWDTASGRERITCQTSRKADRPAQVLFSPTGETLAIGWHNKPVRLWSMAAGAPVLALPPSGAGLFTISPDPSGSHLATTHTDRAVRIWDVATGAEVFSMRGHNGDVSSMAFSPGGKTLASGSGDRTVRLWHVATGRELLTLRGLTGGVATLRYSADGKTLAAVVGPFERLFMWSAAATGEDEFEEVPAP